MPRKSARKSSGKPRRLLRKLLLAGAAVLLVLAVAAFGIVRYVTSEPFIKTHILPQVAEALGAPVEVESIAVAPLSSVQLRNLRVGPEAARLLTAGSVAVQYRLMPLLQGTVTIDALTIEDGVVHLVQHPDGTFNLPDPPQAAPAADDQPTAIPDFTIRDVTLKRCALRVTQHRDQAKPLEVRLEDINIAIPVITTGAPITLETRCRGTVTAADLDVRLTPSLDLDLTLAPNLIPSRCTLRAACNLAGTAGAIPLDGRRWQLSVDTTGEKQAITIRNLRFEQQFHDTTEAQFDLNGAANLDPLTARLSWNAAVPDPSLLDLIGHLVGGYSFGRTAIDGKGTIELAADGAVTAEGDLAAGNCTIASRDLPPAAPVNIKLHHGIGYDPAAQTVHLRVLECKILAADREIAAVFLDQPATIALGADEPLGPPTATVTIRTHALDLAMFRPLLPKGNVALIAGQLTTDARLTIQENGKLLSLRANTAAEQLAVDTPEGRVLAAASVSLEAALTNLSQLQIATTRFQLGAPETFLGGTLTGALDLADTTGTLQIKAELTPQPLTRLPFKAGDIPLSDIRFGGSRANWDGTVTLGAGGTVQVASTLRAQQLRIDVPTRDLRSGDPIDCTVRNDCTYAPATNTVRLTAFELQATAAGAPIAAVKLDRPLTVSISEGTLTTDAELTLAVTRVPITIALPFLPALPVTPQDGLLSVDGRLAVSDNGDQVALRANTTLERLALANPDGRVDALHLRAGIDAAIAKQRHLTINTARVAITRDDTVIATAEANGDLDLTDRNGRIGLKATLIPAIVRHLPFTVAGITLNRLDPADTRVTYTGAAGYDGTTARLRGRLDVNRFSLNAPDLDLPPLPPLDLQLPHELSYNLEQALLEVTAMTLTAPPTDIRGDAAPLVHFELLAPFACKLTDALPEFQPKRGLDARVTTNIDLSHFAPLIPADTPRPAAGRLVTQLRLTAPSASAATLAGSVQVRSLRLAGPGLPPDLPPLDVRLHTDIGYDHRTAVAALRAGTVTAADPKGELATIHCTGTLHTALNQPGTRINLIAPNPIDLVRIQALLPPAAEPQEEPAPSDLRATVDFELARLLYHDLQLDDVKGRAIIEGDTYRLERTTCMLNDGPVTLTAALAMPPGAALRYQTDLKAESVPLAPVLSTFTPNYAAMVDGHCTSLTCVASGAGTSFEAIRQQLAGNLDAQLAGVRLRPSSTFLDTVVDVLLRQQYGIGWSDLTFDRARIAGNFSDALLRLDDARLVSPLLRIEGKGSWELGGTWFPDLTLTPAFKGRLAEQVERRQLVVGQSEDGYAMAKPLAFKGNIYDRNHLLGMIAKSAVPGLLRGAGVDGDTVDKIEAVGDLLKGLRGFGANRKKEEDEKAP